MVVSTLNVPQITSVVPHEKNWVQLGSVVQGSSTTIEALALVLFRESLRAVILTREAGRFCRRTALEAGSARCLVRQERLLSSA